MILPDDLELPYSHIPSWYSPAMATKPDQQLFHTTSKWHVGAQNLIPPLLSKDRERWNRLGEREDEKDRKRGKGWKVNRESMNIE